MAITAYSGEFLDELGLNDFEDVARFVPGFEVQNQSPNNPGFVMRGVTSDSGESFVEPRVSVFQDGVSISKSRGSYVELFDIQRVEIVRGPQSTLYGRGALIGAVNIIQNRADPSRLRRLLRGRLRQFRLLELEGMLNVPMGDTAAFRVSGRYRNRDGLSTICSAGRTSTRSTPAPSAAPCTGRRRAGQRRHLRQLPGGPSQRHLLQVDELPPDRPGDRRGARRPAAPIAAPPGRRARASRAARLWVSTARSGASPASSGPSSPTRSRSTSISAYRQFDGIEILDADGISLPVITAAADESGEQFSQELRLDLRQ